MKKLAYVLIVFILVGSAAGAYWALNKKSPKNIKQPPITATPTQTTTLETKTYKNEEFGFKFNYPNDWIIIREDKNVNYYSKLLFTLGQIVVVRGEKAHDESFLVNIVLPKFVENGFWKSQENTSKVIVGGVEGTRYEYEFEGYPQTAVILPFGELKMILGTGGGSKQYLDEFNQILSSFKFLK